jgi:hypothetical protein
MLGFMLEICNKVSKLEGFMLRLKKSYAGKVKNEALKKIKAVNEDFNLKK